MKFGAFDHPIAASSRPATNTKSGCVVEHEESGWFHAFMAEHHGRRWDGALADGFSAYRRSYDDAAVRPDGVLPRRLSSVPALQNLHARPDELGPFGAGHWARRLAIELSALGVTDMALANDVCRIAQVLFRAFEATAELRR